MKTPKHDRTTKYVSAIRTLMDQFGHATNSELHNELVKQFPDVSATTVHRVTARMLERNELHLAPNGPANTLRYDSNTHVHDHFMCQNCGILKDAQLSDTIRPFIENAIGNDCSISGNLTVTGICKKCSNKVV